MRLVRGAWPVAGVVALLAACSSEPASPVGGGDPGRGRRLIRANGCGSCHTIPGIPNAEGLVGPPLLKFGSRSYIAGRLPNNPENLRRWIEDPQAVEPGNAMPDLGISALDARDIAAYLLSLR